MVIYLKFPDLHLLEQRQSPNWLQFQRKCCKKQKHLWHFPTCHLCDLLILDKDSFLKIEVVYSDKRNTPRIIQPTHKWPKHESPNGKKYKAVHLALAEIDCFLQKPQTYSVA